MNETYIKNVVEAALLAAGRPLQLPELAQLFDESARPDAAALRAALESLESDYSERGIEVRETASGFRIQVRREVANEISRLWPERPPRYSRALLETLALIAYRQPITRAEIESVRGVAVNPNIIKTLLERTWVRVVGTRDVPGRPELLGTTKDFLDYFGLRSLEDLPPLAELKAMGEINLQLDLARPDDPTDPNGGGNPGEGGAGGSGGANGAEGSGGAPEGSSSAAAAAADALAGVAEGAAPPAEAGATEETPVAEAVAEDGGEAAASGSAEVTAQAAESDADATADAEPEAEETAADVEAAEQVAVVAGAEVDSADADVPELAPEPVDVMAISAVEVTSSDADESEAVVLGETDDAGAEEIISEEVVVEAASDELEPPEAVAETEADAFEAVEEFVAAPDVAPYVEEPVRPVVSPDDEYDSGDVTVEVETLGLVEARIEATVESDDPPVQQAPASIETGEFELSELGFGGNATPPANLIEAEFEISDLDKALQDADADDEDDDDQDLPGGGSKKSSAGLVSAWRDRDD